MLEGEYLLGRIIETQALHQKSITFHGLYVIYPVSSIKPVMKEKEFGESNVLFFKPKAMK